MYVVLTVVFVFAALQNLAKKQKLLRHVSSLKQQLGLPLSDTQPPATLLQLPAPTPAAAPGVPHSTGPAAGRASERMAAAGAAAAAALSTVPSA